MALAVVPAARHCCHRRHRRRRRHTAAATRGASQNAREAPRLGRSSPAGLCLCLGVAVLCCSLLLLPGADAMAKNEMKESNSLGLLAEACANSYCGVGVNALDLWVSLEERCDVESTPSLLTLWASGGSGGGGGFGGSIADAGGGWSVTSTALVCVGVWSVLAYAGFRSGVRVGTQTKGGYPVA